MWNSPGTGSSRSCLTLDEKAELFSKKQILGSNGGVGPEIKTDQSHSVEENRETLSDDLQDRSHPSIVLTH